MTEHDPGDEDRITAANMYDAIDRLANRAPGGICPPMSLAAHCCALDVATSLMCYGVTAEIGILEDGGVRFTAPAPFRYAGHDVMIIDVSHQGKVFLSDRFGRRVGSHALYR